MSLRPWGWALARPAPGTLVLPQAALRPHPMEDSELVRRLQGGDLEAFEFLFRREGKRIFNLAYRFTRDPAEAEEWAQEAFLLLHRKVRSCREPKAFASFFYRLALNLFISRVRRRRPATAELPASAAAPRQRPELRRALEQAIERLPPGYRAVFLLHDAEGLEHREISARLGISVGTSKSQLHKARLLLRKLLRPWGDSP
ncbi:MAG TPA: RNA polymerase sigma factor [Acidobacteriota bacterium]